MDTNIAFQKNNRSSFRNKDRNAKKKVSAAAGSSTEAGFKRKRAMTEQGKSSNEPLVKHTQRQRGKKKKQKGMNPTPSESQQQGTVENATKQKQKSGSNNNKSKKPNKKNNKKPLHDGTKKAPQPRQRIVCVAERTVIQQIDQKRQLSVTGTDDKDDLVDLPKDQINNLPDVPYKETKNEVVVICTAAASDRAVAEIRTELSIQQRQNKDGNNKEDAHNSFQYLGFDTETRPKFNKGGDNHPPALLQLATQTTAYLFRLSYRGMSQQCTNSNSNTMTESLRALLADTSIIKVGVGIHVDVKELNSVHGSNCCGDGTSYLDLGPLARLRWPKIQRVGLRNLTATVLRFKLSKAQQMKNWEMERLTQAMIAYAAADALVALDLLTAIVG